MPPSSGLMKPNPLSSLNILILPVGMIQSSRFSECYHFRTGVGSAARGWAPLIKADESGLIQRAVGAYLENDRAGPLDREARMPEMQKDRHRQGFGSGGGRILRR